MAMEPASDNAFCPRCHAAFRCGIDDAGPCACAGLSLDGALLAELRERYTGCLCASCLAACATHAKTAAAGEPG